MLTVEPALAFVEASEERRAVEQRPDSVIDLFEADDFTVERVTEKEFLVFPTDRSSVVDLPELEVTVILDRWK